MLLEFIDRCYSVLAGRIYSSLYKTGSRVNKTTSCKMNNIETKTKTKTELNNKTSSRPKSKQNLTARPRHLRGQKG